MRGTLFRQIKTSDEIPALVSNGRANIALASACKLIKQEHSEIFSLNQ